MRLAGQTVSRVAAALLLAGGAMTAAAAPAAAQSHGGGGFHGGGGGGFHGGGGFGGYHGGGYGGYHGGYGGYHGGYYGGFRGGYYGGFGFGCCGYYGGFGYGFGDALLGAALIGGTAAIIASDYPTYYEGYAAPVYPAYPAPAYPPPAYAPYGYAPPPPPPAGVPQGQQASRALDPVEQCSHAALDEAASRGDTGRVTKIDHVDGHPNGARVSGEIEVRRISHNGEVENARFTCTADYGQVTFFKFG